MSWPMILMVACFVAAFALPFLLVALGYGHFEGPDDDFYTNYLLNLAIHSAMTNH